MIINFYVINLWDLGNMKEGQGENSGVKISQWCAVRFTIVMVLYPEDLTKHFNYTK